MAGDNCRKGDQTRAAAILAANPAVFNAQVRITKLTQKKGCRALE